MITTITASTGTIVEISDRTTLNCNQIKMCVLWNIPAVDRWYFFGLDKHTYESASKAACLLFVVLIILSTKKEEEEDGKKCVWYQKQIGWHKNKAAAHLYNHDHLHHWNSGLCQHAMIENNKDFYPPHSYPDSYWAVIIWSWSHFHAF